MVGLCLFTGDALFARYPYIFLLQFEQLLIYSQNIFHHFYFFENYEKNSSTDTAVHLLG